MAEKDLSEYPEIMEQLQEFIKNVIPMFDNHGMENPCIDAEIKVHDGRKFILKLERIDLD